MEVFRQLKPFYMVERKFILASILCLAGATALGLVYPNLLRYLIDDVIKPQKWSLVPALSLTAVAAVTFKGFLNFLSGYFGGKVGNRVAYRMRNACYSKLQELSFTYYDTAKTGDLMSRLTADLEAIRQFVGFGFAQILNMFLMILFGGIMMMSLDWGLTLITLVTIPFLSLPLCGLRKIFIPHSGR